MAHHARVRRLGQGNRNSCSRRAGQAGLERQAAERAGSVGRGSTAPRPRARAGGAGDGPACAVAVPLAQGARGTRCLPRRAARAGRNRTAAEQTDARDAETLAQLVRMGWYREARVKSWAAHAMRHLVGARAQLVGISIDLSNQIRSVLKPSACARAGGPGACSRPRCASRSTAGPRWQAWPSRCWQPGARCATRSRHWTAS